MKRQTAKAALQKKLAESRATDCRDQGWTGPKGEMPQLNGGGHEYLNE